MMLRPGMNLLEGRSWGFPHPFHSSPSHTLQLYRAPGILSPHRHLKGIFCLQQQKTLWVQRQYHCNINAALSLQYQHSTMIHSNMEYKDTEGKRMPSAGPNTFQVYRHWVTPLCFTSSRCAKPQRVSRKQHLQWRLGFQIKDLKTQYGRVIAY